MSRYLGTLRQVRQIVFDLLEELTEVLTVEGLKAEPDSLENAFLTYTHDDPVNSGFD